MNVIFDIGGVVLSWSKDLFLAHNFENPEEYRDIFENIIGSEDWRHLDRGTMSTGELVEIISKRTGLSEPLLQKMMDSIPDVLNPIEKTLDIIRHLKAKGHKLYVLSNMGIDIAAELERRYQFWELFDGIIFSGRIKMVKPDDEIFLHILEKYSLNVKDTVFIDDTKENIAAAEKLGFKTIHFHSADQCEDELTALNCL